MVGMFYGTGRRKVHGVVVVHGGCAWGKDSVQEEDAAWGWWWTGGGGAREGGCIEGWFMGVGEAAIVVEQGLELIMMSHSFSFTNSPILFPTLCWCSHAKNRCGKRIGRFQRERGFNPLPLCKPPTCNGSPQTCTCNFAGIEKGCEEAAEGGDRIQCLHLHCILLLQEHPNPCFSPSSSRFTSFHPVLPSFHPSYLSHWLTWSSR